VCGTRHSRGRPAWGGGWGAAVPLLRGVRGSAQQQRSAPAWRTCGALYAPSGPPPPCTPLPNAHTPRHTHTHTHTHAHTRHTHTHTHPARHTRHTRHTRARVLEAAHQAMRAEVSRRPGVLAASVFGLDDILRVRVAWRGVAWHRKWRKRAHVSGVLTRARVCAGVRACACVRVCVCVRTMPA
jgi:hypothetical protein